VKTVESLTCHYQLSGEGHLKYLESKGVTRKAVARAIKGNPQIKALFNLLLERYKLHKEKNFKIPKTFWLLGRKMDAHNRFLAYVVEYDGQAREIWNQYLLRLGIAA
jgi:hypothetical protein